MTSLAISGIVLACILAGTLLGSCLRAALHERHLTPEAKDVVKLGMGVIGTMTALVLGLVVASAKSSFDIQRNGVAQLAGQVITLDRILAHYGPETKEIRGALKASVADMLQKTWPEESDTHSQGTEGRYEGIIDKIEQLTPKPDTQQRYWQSQALRLATDIGQARWLLFAQKGSSIPTVFLAVLVAWLALILGSFSLFAPPTPTVLASLLVCALVVSSAILLVLELDRPFEGMIQIPSTPLRNALAHLDR